jgi:hypothetical protein
VCVGQIGDKEEEEAYRPMKLTELSTDGKRGMGMAVLWNMD